MNEREISFGLAGVKGVGDAAISSIIEERDKDGPYRSIYEFCSRVDLRRVNKKVLESLIKCGAFDSLAPSRAQLMGGLDGAMEWGAKRSKDSKMGQTTMFDLMSTEESTPKLPKVEEWRENEKLSFEKEALGFYMTGHPLTRYQDQIKRFASYDSQSCQQALDKSEVSICGVVSRLREIRTKRGRRMGFINVEDLSGTVEVVVFSDIYETTAALLNSEVPIYVKGTVDRQDDSVKLLAEEILSLEEIRIRKTQSVHLKVDYELMSKEAFEELKGILHRHPGRLPAYLHLVKPQEEVTVLELPRDLQVGLTEDFIVEVERLFGASSLVLH
jgi:DNA polymerase-3 subunit alpha